MRAWLPIAVLLCGCTDPKHGTVAKVLQVCGHQSAKVAGIDDVSVLLVMDRSRSMAQSGKWPETRAAVEVALSAYDRYLRFGLLMYPTGADVCDVDATPDVPIASGTGADIAAAMAGAELLRGTPTGPALRAAGDILDNDPAGKRVVILATDGRPDCTEDGYDDGNVMADTEAFDAADDLAGYGIPIYVVGIQGSDSASEVLNRIADIGGTAKPGAVGYYDTNSGADVAKALVDIAIGVDGCATALDDHPDAVSMDVKVDGNYVVNDANNGWALSDDDDELRLNGSACLAAPGRARDIDVTWYCDPAE